MDKKWYYIDCLAKASPSKKYELLDAMLKSYQVDSLEEITEEQAEKFCKITLGEEYGQED